MRTSVHVHNFLQDKGIEHEIFLSETPCKTAAEAAVLLGLNPDEVVKSILFLIKKKPVLVILEGSKRVSYKKLKDIYNTSRVYLPDVGKVADLTGYVAGATPPVAHEEEMEIVVDKGVLGKEVIYTGAGERGAILKIRSEDLIKATQARIEDVVEA